MKLIQSASLGFIQGMTEFLPVSSSGHLVIFQHLFKLDQPPIFFDVLVHTATLAAVVFFFKHQLFSLSRQYIQNILIGSTPTVIVGFFLQPYLEPLFSSLSIVGLGLITTSALLFTTYKKTKTSHHITPRKALIIGFFQALAIIPGISRSGSTIASALLLGLKPKTAFTFSFLLSLPAILGALVLQLLDLSIVTTPTPSLLIGFSTALVSGFFALVLLQKIVNNKKLFIFAPYCLTVGVILLVTQALSG